MRSSSGSERLWVISSENANAAMKRRNRPADPANGADAAGGVGVVKRMAMAGRTVIDRAVGSENVRAKSRSANRSAIQTGKAIRGIPDNAPPAMLQEGGDPNGNAQRKLEDRAMRGILNAVPAATAGADGIGATADHGPDPLPQRELIIRRTITATVELSILIGFY